MVGFSLALSTAKRLDPGEDRGQLLRHALRRAVALFSIGLVLQPLPRLARLAFLIFVWTPWRALVVWIAGLQALYLGLMLLVPVPGCTAGPWTLDCNLARFVNEAIRETGMWFAPRPNDPDGILTLLPATTTVIFGAFAGHRFRRELSPRWRTIWLLAAGCGLSLSGELMAIWIPLNKQLWTTSYVFLTAGFASLCFGACYWLADASLLFALANVAGVYVVIWWMYRRRWFLKL